MSSVRPAEDESKTTSEGDSISGNAAGDSACPVVDCRQSEHGSSHAFLHVMGAAGLAFTQPMLDLMLNNPAYLRHYGYSAAAVLITVALIVFGIPVISTLIFQVTRSLLGFLRARQFSAVMIGMLSAVALMFLSRWLSAMLQLRAAGVPDHLMAVLSLILGLVAVRLYLRSTGFRQLLVYCAFGSLVFPIHFFSSSQVREAVFGTPQERNRNAVPAERPKPVVMIVFDGLCGMALLNQSYEIDRERYPGFARLADVSDFYRNASTVHIRTDHAVPAILSASLPRAEQMPLESDYPRNLFRIILDTGQYQMTVFEPLTNMAPQTLLRITNPKPVHAQVVRLMNILLRVWERRFVPTDISALQVDVPREWFRMEKPTDVDPSLFEGKVVYAWDAQRVPQAEHFLSSLKPKDKIPFRFLHIGLPHDPFDLFPSGRLYDAAESFQNSLVGSIDETWLTDTWLTSQAWQRYLFQVQYADHLIDRLLDQLQTAGLLDETLIVVTADHGMAFSPGAGRRIPESSTFPDIVSVPLFIKRPGQTQGIVSDRNVETIDIVPTIVDLLGLPSSPDWDGESILSPGFSKSRKTVTDPVNTILSPDFPERFRYVDRMIAVFGDGKHDDRLRKLALIPELHGESVSEFDVDVAVLSSRLLSGFEQFNPDRPDFIPCYLRGNLVGPAELLPPDSAELAVAVNGIIVGTTRTVNDNLMKCHWSLLLPEDARRDNSDRIQLFEVTRRSDSFRLREVTILPGSVTKNEGGSGQKSR